MAPEFEAIVERAISDAYNSALERIAVVSDELRDSGLNPDLDSEPTLYVKGFETACKMLARICREAKF